MIYFEVNKNSNHFYNTGDLKIEYHVSWIIILLKFRHSLQSISYQFVSIKHGHFTPSQNNCNVTSIRKKYFNRSLFRNSSFFSDQKNFPSCVFCCVQLQDGSFKPQTIVGHHFKSPTPLIPFFPFLCRVGIFHILLILTTPRIVLKLSRRTGTMCGSLVWAHVFNLDEMICFYIGRLKHIH